MKQTLRRSSLSLLLLLSGMMSTYAQQFKWAKGGGTIEDFGTATSTEWERTEYMCTDANGNIYSVNDVGNYSITADTFYRSAGYGSAQNILITSYNCQGQMRWAKLIGSSNPVTSCKPSGISIDNLGNIYIAGLFPTFGGSLYIGYDTVLTSPSMEYLAGGIIQLDTNGNYHWIRFIGDNRLATFEGGGPVAIAVDNANKAHLFTYLKAGVHITPSETSIGGSYDLAYDPSGTLLSSVRIDLDSQWYFNSVVIDPATNKLYVAGQINQSIYGSTLLTDTFFAAAFATDRSRLWQYFCGHGDDDAIVSVALDPAKNLYFSGGGQPLTIGTTEFSFNGDSVAAHSGCFDMSIIMKTDTNGTPAWIQHFDGTSINCFYGLTLLPGNLLAAAGYFDELMISGGVTLNAGIGSDPFFAVVDTSGDIQSVTQIRGDGYDDVAYAIVADNAGNLYIGGEVADSIPGGSTIPAYHSVGGNTDFFVLKYGVDCSCTTGPVASYTDTGTHTIGVTYTGTTAGLDSVVWRFADGGTATGITAYHTYTLTGTYRVCGTVYTTCGSDIYCTDVTILCGLPPVASFIKTGTHTLAVNYTGSTISVDSVGWVFGDGFRDTGATVTHTYSATGIYHVCAVAHSMCGNDTACHYDTVVCVAPPAASFTHSGTITISTTYTGTTTGVDSIGWLFGDGARYRGTTATHTYTSPGIYNICVVAHSPCGNDTTCHSDTVLCVLAPVASFTDTGIVTLGTTYTGRTTAIDSIVWDFGDGSSTVTGTTSIHTFSAIGTYHVCVTAYSPCGSNTICHADTILCITPPVASFTDTGTHIIGFVYTGTTVDMDSVVWSFGDGHTATTIHPVHTYTASGTYHVCVTSYNGCGVDSVCRDVTVTVHHTGVSQLNNSSINVYPNPADDELNITGLTESTNFRFLTVAGSCVLKGSLQKGSDNISMNAIVPGVYVLELTGLDGEREMVRVVKE